MAEFNWLPYGHRHKYPHLSPADTAIWNRFIARHPAEYTRASYDVRVGAGNDPGSIYDPNIRIMAVKLTQLRIDVLAEHFSGFHLIELKHDPGVSAIGQLLSYNDHLRNENPELQPLRLKLICNRLSDDLIYICNQRFILYEIV